MSFKKLWNDVAILYLFNKSDMKTIVVFSGTLAKSDSLTRLLCTLFWFFIALLQFTVSNQSIGEAPKEDLLNKPYRPIPSKRISVESARYLRWMLVPINLAISGYLGALPSGAVISVLTVLYNEARGDQHWFTRNLLCGGFYAGFEWGLGVVSETRSEPCLMKDATVFVVSTLIIFTTIHASDFRDNTGDALCGRRTFTLAFPTLARISMPVALIGWSIILFYSSQTHVAVRWFQVMLGILIGVRFLWLRGKREDQRSYDLYHIWLGVAHCSLSELDADLIRSGYVF